MDRLDEKLADRVREVRESLGLSQSELADRMTARGHNFQQQTVNRIEAGNRKVTYGEAVDLAISMGHTAEGLVGVTGEEALVTKGARLGEASNLLSDSSINYADALFEFAKTADEVPGELRETQQKYFKVVYARQTPAMLTLDAGLAVRSAISRANIENPGPYLQQLLAAIDRDEKALRRGRLDLDDIDKHG